MWVTDAEIKLFHATYEQDVSTDVRAAAIRQYGGTDEEAVAVVQKITLALRTGARVDFPGGTLYPDGSELVNASDACPDCGEQRQDELIWDDLGTAVTCQMCDRKYVP